MRASQLKECHRYGPSNGQCSVFECDTTATDSACVCVSGQLGHDAYAKGNATGCFKEVVSAFSAAADAAGTVQGFRGGSPPFICLRGGL